MAKRSLRTRRRPGAAAESRSENGHVTRLRWAVVGTVAGVAIAGALLIQRSLRPAADRKTATGETSAPLPEFALRRTGLAPDAAARLIGLDVGVPDTIDGLKKETLDTCRQLTVDLADRPEAHGLMALTFRRFGQTADAIQCWQRSLELAPDFVPAILGIAAVAKDKAEYDKAETLLRKAVRLNPRLPETRSLLTQVLLDQGRAEEALPVALEQRQLFTESHEAWFWLGQAYLQAKQYEKAKDAHEKAVEIDPGFTLSYHSLAVVCSRLGDRKKAAEYRQKFAELKNKDLDRERNQNKTYHDLQTERITTAHTHLCAGNIYWATGAAQKAEAHWVRAVAVDPRDTDSRQALADCYQQQNRLADAVHVREQLVAMVPEHAEYRTALAELQVRLNRYDLAEAEFRQAVEIAPRSAAAQVALVKFALETGRAVPEAVEHADVAVQLEPSAANYLLLSAICEETGDRQGALAAAEQAVKLAPDSAEPRQVYEYLKSAN